MENESLIDDTILPSFSASSLFISGVFIVLSTPEITITLSETSERVLAYSSLYGVSKSIHFSTVSGSMRLPISRASMPIICMAIPEAEKHIEVRNRSWRTSCMRSAASITVRMRGHSIISSGDIRSSGTGDIVPEPLHLDEVTIGCVSLVPGDTVHPRDSASAVMSKGILAVANPNSSDGWSARRTILSASKCAAGQ